MVSKESTMQSISAKKIDEILVQVGDTFVRLTHSDARHLVKQLQDEIEKFNLEEFAKKVEPERGCQGFCACSDCPQSITRSTDDIPF